MGQGLLATLASCVGFRRNGFKRLERRKACRLLRYERLEERQLLATYIVNNLNDSGFGSLRQALLEANNNPNVGGPDVVRFDVTGTIALTSGELLITDDVILHGPGADELIIDASASDPTPFHNNGDGSRVFRIDDDNANSTIDVQIIGLTITGGDVNDHGGGIFSSESLFLSGVVVRDNAVAIDLGGCVIRNGSTNLAGGGVFSRGMVLEISDSDIELNSVTVNLAGASIYQYDLAISGGGVFATGSNIITSNSRFRENAVGVSAFGVSVEEEGMGPPGLNMVVRGGAIYQNFGNLFLTTTSISQNTAEVNLSGSTVANIVANLKGGGVCSDGMEVGIANSLISGNEMSFVGIGLSTAGGPASAVELYGAGIHFETTPQVFVTHSSIANNVAVADFAHASLHGLGNSRTSIRGGGLSALTQDITTDFTTVSDNHVVASFNIISRNGTPSLVVNADGGGMFLPFGGLVRSSTVSGNTATTSAEFNAVQVADLAQATGGGIQSFVYLHPTGLLLQHSTITGNRAVVDAPNAGNQVYLAGAGVHSYQVTLSHTVVANNIKIDVHGSTSSSDLHHGDALGSTAHYSLVEVLDGPSIGGTNLILGIDARLGPLADNGGFRLPDGSRIKTHSPVSSSSPLVDAGDPTAVGGISTIPLYDQRGMPFERIVDGNGDSIVRIDIGAIEFKAMPAPCPPGDYNDNGLADTADYVIWRKLLGTINQLANEDPTATPGVITNEDYVVWCTNYGAFCEQPIVTHSMSSSSHSHGRFHDYEIIVGVAGTFPKVSASADGRLGLRKRSSSLENATSQHNIRHTCFSLARNRLVLVDGLSVKLVNTFPSFDSDRTYINKQTHKRPPKPEARKLHDTVFDSAMQRISDTCLFARSTT